MDGKDMERLEVVILVISDTKRKNETFGFLFLLEGYGNYFSSKTVNVLYLGCH